MELILNTNIDVYTSNTNIIENLKKELIKKNPEYYKKQRMNQTTEGIDKYYIMFDEYEHYISIPRGRMVLIKELSVEFNDKITKITNNRSKGKSIDVSLNFNEKFEKFEKLFEYQKMLIWYLGRNTTGVGIMPCGCITDDSLININKNGKDEIHNIRKIYNIRTINNIKKIDDKFKNINIKSYNNKTNTIINNKVINVLFSGYKKVYELKLENNFKIKTTIEHLIMTKIGFIELGNLRLNDYIMCYENKDIPIYSKLKTMEYIGYEHVYDIQCISPHNNFVANGIVIHNSGKSTGGLGLIAQKKVSTLIIVSTSELFEQWQDIIIGNEQKELNPVLKGNFIFSKMGQGIKEIGDITISLIQTLYRYNSKKWDEINNNYGMIIFDECQMCPANSFLKVLKNLKQNNIYGLTATPNRKDNKQFLLYNYIGKIRYELKDEELTNKYNRLVPVKVKYIKTKFSLDFDEVYGDWPTLVRIISSNYDRNQLILKHVIEDINNGLFPMIMVNRQKQGRYFLEKLSKNFEIGILDGRENKIKRGEHKAKALKNELDCLICIDKIAKLGLDIPPLDSIYMPYIINNESDIKQIVGRGRRIYKNKTFCKFVIFQDFIFETKFKMQIEHKIFKNIKKNHENWFKKWKFEILD